MESTVETAADHWSSNRRDESFDKQTTLPSVPATGLPSGKVAEMYWLMKGTAELYH